MGRYLLKKDSAGEWRWRYIATNGKIIAMSSEGYNKKSDAENGIKLVKGSYNDPVDED